MRGTRTFASLLASNLPLLAGALSLALGASCGGGGSTGGGDTGQTSSKSGTDTGVTGGAGGASTGTTTGSSTGSGTGSSTDTGSATSTGTGAGGTGTTTTTSATGGAGGAGPKPCTADADCAGDPGGAFCQVSTGTCVACLPSNDPCAVGQHCDPATNTCVLGCKADGDCAGDPSGHLRCDTQAHTCVACLTEADCPAGQICTGAGGTCVAGCTPTHDCGAGLTCCGSTCEDTTTNVAHCGACNNACPVPPHTEVACVGSTCHTTQCAAGFVDCNGDPADGCEQNLMYGPCVCVPGQTQSCYEGLPGTLNVGPCKAGVQTCDVTGTSWGNCVGSVLPTAEICNNGVDDDCNGLVDDIPDLDGDGWTRCNGDCCEVAGFGCSDPKLVNPGAFEDPTDGVDNDCDGVIDNPVTTVCSSTTKLTGVTGTDVANAMDICQTTTPNPPLAQKKWGLISATQLFANGATPTATQLATLQNQQTAIKTKFGTGGVVPKKNATFAVISSGAARDASDAGWVLPDNGSDYGNTIAFPGGGALATYVNAHGGALLPGHCGTTTCPVGSGANDSVNVRLQIRVPTNAKGFSYDFRFYSAEYQDWQCTAYNDYFLASLTTGAAGIPADHNISFDSLNNPVSVNNGFFQDCGGNAKACGTCPFGTGSLVGTGFEQVYGGSTEWLTTDAPIVPGETMILELMVFDVSDNILDTLVLLDNFRWSLTPVTVGTHT